MRGTEPRKRRLGIAAWGSFAILVAARPCCRVGIARANKNNAFSRRTQCVPIRPGAQREGFQGGVLSENSEKPLFLARNGRPPRSGIATFLGVSAGSGNP